MAPHTTLSDELNAFLDAIPFQSISQHLAQRLSMPADEIEAKFHMYANESRATVQLIEPNLNKTMRILEVGAGLCLTSLFLKQQGYRVTALEPALGGFGIFEALKGSLLEYYADLELQVLNMPAQSLNAEVHGIYDFIFSNNVVEHIPDWRSAMTAMMAVLNHDGMMKHACPNYTVPYEPHYGVPVLHWAPEFSRRTFLSEEVDLDIWDSLNFITCSQVKQYCRKQGVDCQFETALLYKALRRIQTDEQFKQRHQGVVATLAMAVMNSPLHYIIQHIPPQWSTPMVMTIRKKV